MADALVPRDSREIIPGIYTHTASGHRYQVNVTPLERSSVDIKCINTGNVHTISREEFLKPGHYARVVGS